MDRLRKFYRDDAGTTAIEYGIIATLLSVVLVTALGTTGLNLGKFYDNLGQQLSAAFTSAQ